jgi:hypothetical protein
MALYRLPLVLRSFGIALGIFLFLNLALALERPELSTTGVWLQLKLAEPFRSSSRRVWEPPSSFPTRWHAPPGSDGSWA